MNSHFAVSSTTLNHSTPTSTFTIRGVIIVHMSSPKDRLKDSGVSTATIDDTLRRIADTTDLIFRKYDIARDDRDHLTEVIQTRTLKTILRFGENNPDKTIVSQFDDVAADFDDPTSQAARSNITLIIGMASADEETSDELAELSSQIIAQNYAASDA